MKTLNTRFGKFALLLFLLIGSLGASAATRQMEYLDRGVVAVKVNNGVYISWRYLGTDSPSIGFNIYRDGTKVNDAPITTKTNFVDTKGGANSKYVVKSVLNGKETEASKAVTPWASQQKTLKLRRPGTNYAGNDMSVGDVDGDGEYELFMKWYPNNAKDNSQSGKTDNCIIDCYKMDGTFLWRIDLGVNIRSGAHYTQYQVYDYDGDGKCEMVCKTAPGTKDGKGKYVILNNDDPKKDYRNGDGYVLSGPEYLTIFNGQTGEEIHTVPYNPARGSVNGWGDGYGNRVDRFLACTAYLDGVHPSIVMCRGYYTRSTLAAYDFKNGKLVQRWYHNSDQKGQGAYGEGFHNVSVADVDGDGKDEIIYGSAVIDDNGKLIYRTGYGHGDAMHVSDLDPSHAGLEGWFVHEEKGSAYGYELRDLKTGKVLWGKKTGTDNGRGMAADIDPKHKGFECWSSAPGVFDCKGNKISDNKPSVNFRLYWDGDLQDELLDGNKCDKWNGNGTTRLITFKGNACNGTKNTPCLSADILGDWREEVILHDGDNIYIYTTTIESKYRLFTLMHDPVYRCGVAWQNTAYNQPPHLGFYIGDGIDNVKQPDIYTPGNETPQAPVIDEPLEPMPEGLKHIAYICDPSNANFQNDLILKMLKEDETLYVREINATKSGYDYTDFDMILISETTPSTAAVMQELKSIQKPTLCMKVQGYKSADGAWNWAKNGFGDNTTATNLIVEESQKSHVLFKDVNFINGNEVQMVSEVNTKALTYMNPEAFTDASGKIQTIASIKGEEAVSIFEIEKESSIAGDKISNPFIQIGLNSSSYGNITEEGLTIVKNACLYLMGELKNEQVETIASTIVSDINTSFYPNPVKESLYIDIQSDRAELAEINLFSMDGTLIDHEETMLQIGRNIIHKETDKLPKKSACILNLRIGGKTIAEKIILCE